MYSTTETRNTGIVTEDAGGTDQAIVVLEPTAIARPELGATMLVPKPIAEAAEFDASGSIPETPTSSRRMRARRRDSDIRSVARRPVVPTNPKAWNIFGGLYVFEVASIRRGSHGAPIRANAQPPRCPNANRLCAC
jgi:hypothetical protein